MSPHIFKEELSSLLCCHSLLAWYEYSHLGNLSTTTNIVSCRCLVVGYPVKQSIEIDSHGQLGTRSGVYNPCRRFEDLAMTQTMDDRMYLLMSYLSESQYKYFWRIRSVFATPKCLAVLLWCAFQMSLCRCSPVGTQSCWQQTTCRYETIDKLQRNHSLPNTIVAKQWCRKPAYSSLQTVE